MNIAALHVTVVRNGFNYSVWVNLCINFFMDLDAKIGILDWILTKIKKFIFERILKKHLKKTNLQITKLFIQI
jgi:hypothetical protein